MKLDSEMVQFEALTSMIPLEAKKGSSDDTEQLMKLQFIIPILSDME
jgi:hypothetical protein